MSTSGHLFLRGAPHLALVSLGGGGEERGGEKRLAERNRSVKKKRHWRAGNQPHTGKLSSMWSIVAATLAAGGETVGGWDGTANVADRGDRFDFLPWTEAATPLPQKMLKLRTSCRGWQHCSRFQSPSIEMCWLGEQPALFLCPRIHRGTSFGKGRSYLCSFSMFSLCHKENILKEP